MLLTTAAIFQNDQAFNKARSLYPHLPVPTQAQLYHFSNYMSRNDWDSIYELLLCNPLFGVSSFEANNMPTSVLHTAISARGKDEIRGRVILKILEKTPSAAEIYNGGMLLPIHMICQRSTKMANALRESLIRSLLTVYPDACMVPGGTFERLPLHILFTDYYSEDLFNFVLDMAPAAAMIMDKKRALPIHIACMRSCSASKVRALVAIFPDSIFEEYEGKTPLQLALGVVDRAHPNPGLISALRKMESSLLANNPAQQNIGNGSHGFDALSV